MGYTHYWTPSANLVPNVFKQAVSDCRKVCRALHEQDGLAIQRDFDDPRPAQFTPTTIWFNGVGNDGHETFAVLRDGSGSLEFCKTAEKPYDSAVCACLLILNHYFGPSFLVDSDGDGTEPGWMRAREVCQAVLGYGAKFSLPVRA